MDRMRHTRRQNSLHQHEMAAAHAGAPATSSTAGMSPHLSPPNPSMSPDLPSKLQIWVEGAREIKYFDLFSSCAPFCVIRLAKSKQYQTEVVEDASSTVTWNFGPLELDYHNETRLIFSVYDKD